MDHQAYEMLARSVKFMSCGKLKRASELIAQAARIAAPEHKQIIRECRELGLVVQTRKYIGKADELLNAGDATEAFNRYLGTTIKGVPHELTFQLLHNKAVCLSLAERYAEALCCFQEALLYNPSHSRGLQNTAFAFMAVGEYDMALKYFGEVIRIDRIEPKSLLHVLYCAAICRQQLHLTSEEHAEAAQAQLDAEQALHRLAALTGRPPTPPQPIGTHWSVGHATVPRAQSGHHDHRPLTIETGDDGLLQLKDIGSPIFNHFPFRRLRYDGPKVDRKSAIAEAMADETAGAVAMTVSTRVISRFPSAARYGTDIIGSPVPADGRGAARVQHHRVPSQAVPEPVTTVVGTPEPIEESGVPPQEKVKVPAVVSSCKPSLGGGGGRAVRLKPATSSAHTQPDPPVSQTAAPAPTAAAAEPPSEAVQPPQSQSQPEVANTSLDQATVAASTKPRRATLPQEGILIRSPRSSYPTRQAMDDDAVSKRSSPPPALAPNSQKSHPVEIPPIPNRVAQTASTLVRASEQFAATVAQSVQTAQPVDRAADSQRNQTRRTSAVLQHNDNTEAQNRGTASAHTGANSSAAQPAVLPVSSAPSPLPQIRSAPGSGLVPSSEQPSWQHQEVERALGSRRHVDQYTVTPEDVDRLRGTEGIHVDAQPPDPAQCFPYDSLKSPGPFPPGVDVRHREYYLAADEFRRVLRVDKSAWAELPAWRRRAIKQAHGLF